MPDVLRGGRRFEMKEKLNINQNFKLYHVEDKSEKFYMKIIDVTIGFALIVVLIISVYTRFA